MRKENSIKNMITSIIPYFIITLLSIFRVRLFLHSLGEEIYSTNQVFNQIFSYLSLIDGGIGCLIVQKYYKLFVDKNKDEINYTYSKSKRTMNYVSLLILIIGIFLSFFIKLFVNNSLSRYYLQLIFILYLLRSIIEYIFISPRFVIQADQKLYKINLLLNIYKIIEMLIEMYLLTKKLDYAIILVVTTIIRTLAYICCNKVVFKEYPWLKKIKTKKNDRFKDVGYMFWHKISGTVKMNTDIIILSITQNPLIVTIYSSYNYIIKSLSEVVYLLTTSISSSVGNVFYKENENKKIEIFEKVNMIFLYLSTIITTILYIEFDDFVELWIGTKYIMEKASKIVLCITLFQTIASRSLILVYETLGKYQETKWIVAIEAIMNLVLSTILVIPFGMFGVILATALSGIISIVILPKYIYKEIFNKDYKKYIIKYLIVFGTTIILMILYELIKNKVSFEINIFSFAVSGIINSIILTIILTIIFIIIFKEFKEILKECINFLRRKKRI